MSRAMRCIVNQQEVETSVSKGMAALDFIREQRRLCGTKEGCKEGECGACTVLIGELTDEGMEYKAVASCLQPLGDLEGKHIVTVEGINRNNGNGGLDLTPVQRELTEEGASQCGFCTPGFVMGLTGFFLTSPDLDYSDAEDALDGNICRCTGYVSIQRAAKNLCDHFGFQGGKKNRIKQLVEWEFLPDYFLGIGERLESLRHTPPYGHPSQEGNKRTIVAGGTDLYVQRPGELLDGDRELDFTFMREELRGIKREGDRVSIGAAATVEEMRLSPLINEFFPAIREHLNLVSSTIMRNRATLAGNFVNASPIGDLSIMMLALDAGLVMTKDGKKRELKLNEFFKGYKQMDLREGELIEAVTFLVSRGDTLYHFEKVSQRKYLDIASCNTAVSIRTDGRKIADIHMAAGGVAPVPLYLAKTGDYFKGKEITGAVIREGVRIMENEIAPISDVRGSAHYKTLLLRNLIFAHFITLFPDRGLEEVLP
ncbi:MAG: hypothetical protein GY940_27145 [bacterium]|nr:hypothetical protein [bacterium]